MTHTIKLEALYPEMEEATIGSWLVREGDLVTSEQPLAELITDKVAYEYQSPLTGTILAMLPAEKSVIPVGTTLLVIGDAHDVVEDLETLLAENRRLAEEREASLSAVLQATSSQTAPPSTGGTGGIRATPAARRLARERGVDLSAVTGSGPGGMITVEDIP